MKKVTTLLSLGTVALLIGAANPSNAQYQAVGDDGIAASPRLRQILNERQAADSAFCNCSDVAFFNDAGYKVTGEDGIAASPKMRQILNERRVAVGSTGSSIESSTGAGYR